MKLFRNLLIAPASLGLLAPIAANANEVNLNQISNYSEVDTVEFANSFNKVESDSSLKPLLAGGEGMVGSSHDGGFSSTTSASFSSNFYVGATNDDQVAVRDMNDTVMAGYDFQIGLNTSFTGEDSLDITIDSGNAGGAGYAEFGGDDTTDKLTVDGVSYTFPVLGATVMVGDNTDGSALFTTACVYGGPGDTLDDCGNVNANIANGGAMAGASYDFGNGFSVALGYAGPESGIMTEESMDAKGINAAYTADNYGVSLTYSVVETSSTEEDTFTALNAYYTPEGLPSISFGIEEGVDDSRSLASNDGLSSIFVGLTWDEVGPGSLGVAWGSKTPTVEGTDDQFMYEAYYAYPINDGMTVTPLVFVKQDSTAGIDDETGLMVKTSFSF